MVVLTIVTQKNGDTIYFSPPLPKVHFMKLLACSIYNSWDTLKSEGSAALDDSRINPNGKIHKLPPGHYDLDSLAKGMTDLFLSLPYDGVITETNSPLGQLVIKSKSQITLDSDLTKLFGTQRLLLETAIKRVITTTAYFIHCDLIDGYQNIFNGKRSNILAKVDITGKPYEKVIHETASPFPFRKCLTDSHVNSITLSVRDEDGELFDFKDMPIEFELELN